MTTPTGDEHIQPDLVPRQRGALFWVTVVAGWLLIAWGLRGALMHHVDTRPAELARFVVGSALVHDLVFAPLVLAGGVAIARVVPATWRAPTQAALIISGTLALFAYPEVRGFAHKLNNPTSLPHNYTVNTVLIIFVVCVITAAITAVHRRLKRP